MAVRRGCQCHHFGYSARLRQTRGSDSLTVDREAVVPCRCDDVVERDHFPDGGGRGGPTTEAVERQLRLASGTDRQRLNILEFIRSWVVPCKP
jgi:hypothetical protein